MKIAVVIPAYNEVSRIEAVLKDIPSFLDGHEVIKIVVDDGSNDKTSQIAKSADNVLVFRHRTNLGKGAAVKTGCDAACKMKVDYIVLMDGDGQHNPKEMAKLLKPAIKSRQPILVIGSRRKSKDMPFAMRFGNMILSNLVRWLFGIKIRDTQSGFRCFSALVYPNIRWKSADYGMETEMLILASYRGINCREIDISTIYHDHYKGTTVIDGLRVLLTLLKWRLLWSREFRSSASYSA